MSNFVNNIPTQLSKEKKNNSMLQIIDIYNSSPFTVNAAVYDSIIGFLENKGFKNESATSIAYIILKQAYVDNINPLEIIETLKGVSNIELNNLITEILNYNRLKTSCLGTATPIDSHEFITRNIVA